MLVSIYWQQSEPYFIGFMFVPYFLLLICFVAWSNFLIWPWPETPDAERDDVSIQANIVSALIIIFCGE